MMNRSAPHRARCAARGMAVSSALAAAPAWAMDANAGIFMLSVWGAFLFAAVAGTLAGWRGWRLWGSLWRSYLGFSMLLPALMLVFSTRGASDVIGISIPICWYRSFRTESRSSADSGSAACWRHVPDRVNRPTPAPRPHPDRALRTAAVADFRCVTPAQRFMPPPAPHSRAASPALPSIASSAWPAPGRPSRGRSRAAYRNRLAPR